MTSDWYSWQSTSSTCGAIPNSLARRRSRTISFSVSAGRSVVRATSLVTCLSVSPQFPRETQVSTMRCDARGAIAGRIWSVKRASDERTPEVFSVWWSSPKATTPFASPRNASTALAGEANFSATGGGEPPGEGGPPMTSSAVSPPSAAAPLTDRRG